MKKIAFKFRHKTYRANSWGFALIFRENQAILASSVLFTIHNLTDSEAGDDDRRHITTIGELYNTMQLSAKKGKCLESIEKHTDWQLLTSKDVQGQLISDVFLAAAM